MDRRPELDARFEEILGSPHVYFSPPANVRLIYPCIVYSITGEDAKFADNVPYARKKRYNVKVIVREPDSPIPDKIAALPMCTFDRYYVADNLSHFVYNIYH